MIITQEMNYLILQMEDSNMDELNMILKKGTDHSNNKIIDLFLKSNIKKMNAINNHDFLALVNEQGTFYFYERKE